MVLLALVLILLIGWASVRADQPIAPIGVPTLFPEDTLPECSVDLPEGCVTATPPVLCAANEFDYAAVSPVCSKAALPVILGE